jgi:hypothetical protein
MSCAAAIGSEPFPLDRCIVVFASLLVAACGGRVDATHLQLDEAETDGQNESGEPTESGTSDVSNNGSQCVHNPRAALPLPIMASDTLPVGVCEGSPSSCDLVVRHPCFCPPSSIRVYYHCECRNALWSCVETEIQLSW